MNSLRNVVARLLMVAVVARGGGAQELHVLPLADAAATAVGVLWSHGLADDPVGRRGLARVMVGCRLRAVRAVAPAALASGVFVGDDHQLVFVILPPAHDEVAEAVLAALAARDLPFDDDAFELEIARAALVADDAEFLFPGPMMATAARRAFGGARAMPRAGAVDEILALSPAIVRAALARPAAVRVGLLGQVSDALRRSAAAVAWPRGDAPVRGDVGFGDGAAVSAVVEPLQHGRADAPWHLRAALAPAALERPSLAVALEVAAARAARDLRPRGELLGRAAIVSWSWLHADPLVCFYRRGESSRKLREGERAVASRSDELAATRRELDGFLSELTQRPPSGREVAAAKQRLRSRLSLPAPGGTAAWARAPMTMPGRLQVLLLRTHHGVRVSDLDAVDAAAVRRSLSRWLDPARCVEVSLLPPESPKYGWRSR